MDDILGFYDMTRFVVFEVALERRRIWFGRDTSRVDVGLSDDSVSEEHCFAERIGDGELRVRDCGSKNGTWVNGVRIEGAAIFQSGQRLYLGNTELVCLRTGGPDFGPAPHDSDTLWAAYNYHRTYRAVRDALGVSIHAVREAVVKHGGPAATSA